MASTTAEVTGRSRPSRFRSDQRGRALSWCERGSVFQKDQESPSPALVVVGWLRRPRKLPGEAGHHASDRIKEVEPFLGAKEVAFSKKIRNLPHQLSLSLDGFDDRGSYREKPAITLQIGSKR